MKFIQKFLMQNSPKPNQLMRANWPKAEEILFDENFCKLGDEVLKVIFKLENSNLNKIFQ